MCQGESQLVLYPNHMSDYYNMIGIQVKVAIIGVTAGGVGLNFSAAQSVVFVELPKSASEMLQVMPCTLLNVFQSIHESVHNYRSLLLDIADFYYLHG